MVPRGADPTRVAAAAPPRFKPPPPPASADALADPYGAPSKQRRVKWYVDPTRRGGARTYIAMGCPEDQTCTNLV